MAEQTIALIKNVVRCFSKGVVIWMHNDIGLFYGRNLTEHVYWGRPK